MFDAAQCWIKEFRTMPFKYCYWIVIIKGLNFVAIFLSDVTDARRYWRFITVMNMKRAHGIHFISKLIDFLCSRRCETTDKNISIHIICRSKVPNRKQSIGPKSEKTQFRLMFVFVTSLVVVILPKWKSHNPKTLTLKTLWTLNIPFHSIPLRNGFYRYTPYIRMQFSFRYILICAFDISAIVSASMVRVSLFYLMSFFCVTFRNVRKHISFNEKHHWI